jgi:hypothetical protein
LNRKQIEDCPAATSGIEVSKRKQRCYVCNIKALFAGCKLFPDEAALVVRDYPELVYGNEVANSNYIIGLCKCNEHCAACEGNLPS